MTNTEAFSLIAAMKEEAVSCGDKNVEAVCHCLLMLVNLPDPKRTKLYGKEFTGDNSPVDASNIGVLWTKEEEDLLMAMYNSGKTITTIASTLGRKKGGIVRRIEKIQESAALLAQ